MPCRSNPSSKSLVDVRRVDGFPPESLVDLSRAVPHGECSEGHGMTDNRDRPAALWPFMLLCAVAAGWIVFGSLHQEQHADAIINVLASLYAWEPFFWEQDRYGALVPLL